MILETPIQIVFQLLGSGAANITEMWNSQHWPTHRRHYPYFAIVSCDRSPFSGSFCYILKVDMSGITKSEI